MKSKPKEIKNILWKRHIVLAFAINTVLSSQKVNDFYLATKDLFQPHRG